MYKRALIFSVAYPVIARTLVIIISADFKVFLKYNQKAKNFSWRIYACNTDLRNRGFKE